jgi:hypothetical protein
MPCYIYGIYPIDVNNIMVNNLLYEVTRPAHSCKCRHLCLIVKIIDNPSSKSSEGAGEIWPLLDEV